MSDAGPSVVIGAGPTAAAAAKGLLAAGQRVLVLDTGLSLEPEREAARQRMAATTPENWQPADVSLTKFTAAGTSVRGYKRLFGSDLTFRDDGVLELSVDAGVGARPSYALGGLSNVWGSGLLRYTDRDLGGWPIAASELDDGYRAVLDFVPYSGEEDEFAERYPLMRAPDGPLIRTEAGEAVLSRLRRHRSALTAAGYYFGASRLAVRVGHPAPANGCVYCGHCLDGCPYGHIYSAAQTIEELRREGLIEYRSGLHVDRVSEQDEEVVVDATALADGAPVTIRSPRAFLGAGVISTTIILQRSGLLPARAEIADSQALYLPFAWIGRTGETGREPGHTLAQSSIVLDDPAVCANPIHITLYTYNDGLSERAREARPRLSSLLGPALDSITRHLVVGICFFHSDDSDHVTTSWEKSSDSVRLEPLPNPDMAATARRFQRALLRSLGPIGLIPLAPLAEIAPPGGGYHYGASIPMSQTPVFGQCDTLGRPSATRRIHVVDASCFPTVPGGAITFSGMANSYRIATAAAREEPAMIGVTGANGYVGGRITAHLRASGIDAIALVRRPPPGDAFARRYELGEPLDRSLLDGIETVVHAAYDASAQGRDIRVRNVTGSMALLEGLHERGGRMLLVSSLSAFEGTRSQYGRAKLELERAVRERDGIAVRPGLVFGAGAGGLFGAMVRALSRRALAPMIGGGSQRLFVAHDEELSQLVAALVAGRAETAGPIFAAHEVPTTLRAIAEQIAAAGGHRLVVLPLPPALVALGLRSAEIAGIPLPFRSDSLRSLLHPIGLDQVSSLARGPIAFPALEPELWLS